MDILFPGSISSPLNHKTTAARAISALQISRIFYTPTLKKGEIRMHITTRFAPLVAGLFFSLTLHAASSPEATAIHAMGTCTFNVMKQSQLQLAAVRGNAGDAASNRAYMDGVADMNTCVEDRFKPAIDAAGTRQDLREAIKAFYLTQKSFVGSFGSRGESAARNAMSDASARVNMEMKLAGVE